MEDEKPEPKRELFKKIPIDWKKVDQYLKAQCNGVGIAGILGISYDTLTRRCLEEHGAEFAEYSRQKKTEGLEMLRAKQFQMAMEGDKTMCVWLGKQYLEQRDKKDLSVENVGNPFLAIMGNSTKIETVEEIAERTRAAAGQTNPDQTPPE